MPASFEVEHGTGPHVLRPQPPHQPGDQHSAADSGPRQLAGNQRGDLGDGEHEDQVHEEFEVAGVALLRDLTGLCHHVCGHPLKRFAAPICLRTARLM